MSAKQLRRLRGDKGCLGGESIGADGSPGNDSETYSSSSDEDDAPVARQSAFALLGGDDDSDDSDSDSGSGEDRSSSSESGDEQGADAGDGDTSALGERGKVRGKGKEPSGENESGVDGSDEEEGLDDLDRALLELGEALPAGAAGHAQGDGVGEGGEEDPVTVLLSADRRSVNPDVETRRMFGSRAFEGARGGGGNSSGRRPQRSVLVTTSEHWPRYANPGIAMAAKFGADATFELTYDEGRYAEPRAAFEAAVATYDHNSFFDVIAAHPYCVEALLQLAQVCRHHGQHERAAELNARAVFAFERAFPSDFDPFCGKHRVPRDSDAADAFYSAMFRTMVKAGQRGCTTTAFELSRFLLSLDPAEDPSFSLLLMDHYALRAGRERFLLSMLAVFEDGALSCMPNWAFNAALAVRRLVDGRAGQPRAGDTAGADDAAVARLDPDGMLVHAMLLFPSVVVPLVSKCGVQVTGSGSAAAGGGSGGATSAVVLGSYFMAQPKSAALQHLSILFAERNHALWRDPPIIAWIKRCVKVCEERIARGDPEVRELTTLRESEFPPRAENVFSGCGLVDYADVAEATLPQDDPLGVDVVGGGGGGRGGRGAARVNREVIPENDFLAFLTTMLPWNRVAGAAGGPAPPQPPPAEGGGQ